MITYVGVFKALSTLPRQKRTAISMAKPRTPFKSTEAIIDRGIMMAASSISSAARMGQLKPGPISYLN